MAKANKKTTTRNAPTLAAVLGIEPAIEFTLLDRVFAAETLTLAEQMLLAKALDDQENPLTAQADVLARFLNTRLVDGEPVTSEEVMDAVNMVTGQRLFQLLQGQRRARVDDGDGVEGK